MISIKTLRRRFIDSGIAESTSSTDARYIRFLNATLILFSLAQIPIIPLLISLELKSQLLINLLALCLCAVGFSLNRRGFHLSAKILIIFIVTANTVYFSVMFGLSAPTHHWLVPGAVLGALSFKPSEGIWTALMVGLSILIFGIFEFFYLDLPPMVQLLGQPSDAIQAGHASTLFAMILTLILAGMMHLRFADSETALLVEKAQSERLLRAILPEKVARELRDTGEAQAIRHEDVSILFADIVGFTPLAASMPAEEVVALLAEIFKRFDELIKSCGVEKIKTIGDAYMVAGGVPDHVSDHAQRLARCAVGMLDIMAQYSIETGHPLQIRIGLHKGPVVAGVIGTTKFAYDLWGEAVNLASRLESSGEPGCIHVSEGFRACLEGVFKFEERGELLLKGVGATRTHWLKGTEQNAL